jgi:hypothetical protein
MIFRRVCKISKSGNAATGFVMSAFLSVCLSVCLSVYREKLNLCEILYWEAHQKSAERNDFRENSKKYTSCGDLRALMTALITNVTTVTFDINR